ncbi:MAG: hypothetical protein AMQ22_00071 [Candidatus Methanofastidiosum methylothiophilum]|uniref:Uncharacterized protein n=1 Tax=Candidatus Methanofastidiosum methylothiophilum TaxID=1705564 RepID=A0A150J9E6_9EURY|nr:MAG: hypothetical protein AMQ22_00071 [Candidatus Methanofastidiosum methylthiophilus]
MEVAILSEMNKKELDKDIAHYCKFKDFETAKRIAINHGSKIKGYDVEAAINKINELENEENKKAKPA